MEKENQEGVEVEENFDLPEVKEGEEDTTDWKAETQKLREKAISQRERTKTLKQELKDAKKAVEIVASTKDVSKPTKTGELDENALDYLDLKGVTENEDIKVIEDIVKKTGMTVRQAYKDEYVQTRLQANKTKRETSNATPSSTKRGGNQQNNVAAAVAKFEQNGELPSDYALRTEVINAVTDKNNANKPSWH